MFLATLATLATLAGVKPSPPASTRWADHLCTPIWPPISNRSGMITKKVKKSHFWAKNFKVKVDALPYTLSEVNQTFMVGGPIGPLHNPPK